VPYASPEYRREDEDEQGGCADDQVIQPRAIEGNIQLQQSHPLSFFSLMGERYTLLTTASN
jgi:hypothetical protein